jgi:hypothetical protein
LVHDITWRAAVAVRANQRNKRELMYCYISRLALPERRLSLAAGARPAGVEKASTVFLDY